MGTLLMQAADDPRVWEWICHAEWVGDGEGLNTFDKDGWEYNAIRLLSARPGQQVMYWEVNEQGDQEACRLFFDGLHVTPGHVRFIQLITRPCEMDGT